MDKNLKKIIKIKEDKMIKAFNQNNMQITFVENFEELHNYLNKYLCNQKTVALGGSMTLFEAGVIDLIKQSDVILHDRYQEDLTREQMQDIFRKAFTSDLFITSTNALTMDGCLYNIDGNGNRVAAMIYGPKEVIVIAGKNKIFETAVTLIKSKGYDNVTISEICQTAGLAKGSFYVHYNSKEDIVRESYYADMGTYICTHYNEFIASNPNKSVIERITYFLNLEFEFAEYAGYELTCLAYSLNLSACMPGPSEHFSKRYFIKILQDEIESSLAYSSSDFSCNEIFNYFESIVRGTMATWCFSNNSFNIVEQGRKYIKQAVHSIYQMQ